MIRRQSTINNININQVIAQQYQKKGTDSIIISRNSLNQSKNANKYSIHNQNNNMSLSKQQLQMTMSQIQTRPNLIL